MATRQKHGRATSGPGETPEFPISQPQAPMIANLGFADPGIVNSGTRRAAGPQVASGSVAPSPAGAGGPSLRAEVERRVGASRFELWFGEGVDLALSGDGAALEVHVPDVFFRDWIERHFASSLIEAGAAVAGRDVRLSIAVGAKAAGNLAEAVADESARPLLDGTASPEMPHEPGPFTDRAPQGGPASAERPRLRPGLRSRADRAHAPETDQDRAEAAPAGRPRRMRRFDDFVVGASNQLACAAAREMASSLGATFNPLLVHGGIGLGKSHLLEAIAHAMRRARPGLNVIHVTAESFTNTFLEAMRNGGLARFRARFRSAEALIVDDVHFLAAKRATQDEFLHTFNALWDKGAPIVLAADQHPRRISRLPDELVTRFLAGMVVKIEPPDLAARRAILTGRALRRGVDLPDAVAAYIAEHLRASVRELEGALNTVIAQAVLGGKRLDLALARAALKDTIRHTAQAIALHDVERAVCALFEITAEALKSDGRSRALAHPRMIAMYLARKHAGAAYSEIGRFFGGRNHSTVISAEKKVRQWLDAEQHAALLPGFETVGDLVADLERTLGA